MSCDTTFHVTRKVPDSVDWKPADRAVPEPVATLDRACLPLGARISMPDPTGLTGSEK